MQASCCNYGISGRAERALHDRPTGPGPDPSFGVASNSSQSVTAIRKRPIGPWSTIDQDIDFDALVAKFAMNDAKPSARSLSIRQAVDDGC